MTIASEITRIQGAKSDIRQAIIDKGVDVCADLTIDNYACCINDIPTGGGGTLVEVLVVGAGGNGGTGGCNSYCKGGGGGGGGVILCSNYKLTNSDVHIGQPGGGYRAGGDSWIGELTAKGGGQGGGGNCISGAMTRGYRGGSGGGGGTGYCCGVCSDGGDKAGYLNLGTAGQQGNCTQGGGGGGAGGWGRHGCGRCLGGPGFFSDITGEYCEYGRGGDSGNAYGGVGYGGGGGGCCCYRAGTGCQGIVVVRYPTECGYNITGGCKYTCGDYTIHCFTQDDFILSEPITGEYCIGYLVVGGGGKGCGGNSNGAGGGGGDVKFGVKATTSSINIVVGGESCPSCLGDEIIANGGESITCSACCNGGASGSGNPGGAGRSYYYGGGGGGAMTRGADGSVAWCCCGGMGGYGIRGYGGGGGGSTNDYTGGYGNDGGGDGCQYSNCTQPRNCGGGGGGYCGYCECYSCGACGVVDICYPCDGSFGFSTATGGDCCYLCGKICVHRFTSNGTFTITG